jgi:hypothetical protein
MNQMKNVSLAVSGDVLTITVNLKERLGKSASGKTEIVATTAGNQPVPGFEHIVLGVNCYTK